MIRLSKFQIYLKIYIILGLNFREVKYTAGTGCLIKLKTSTFVIKFVFKLRSSTLSPYFGRSSGFEKLGLN